MYTHLSDQHHQGIRQSEWYTSTRQGISRSVGNHRAIQHVLVVVTPPAFTDAQMHTAITRGPPPLAAGCVIEPPERGCAGREINIVVGRGLGIRVRGGRENNCIPRKRSIPLGAGTLDAIFLGPAVMRLSGAVDGLAFSSGTRHTGMRM